MKRAGDEEARVGRQVGGGVGKEGRRGVLGS